MDGWEGTLRDLQQRKEASHWMDGKEPCERCNKEWRPVIGWMGRNPDRPATEKGGQSLDGWEGTLRDLQQRKEASHWMDGKEP